MSRRRFVGRPDGWGNEVMAEFTAVRYHAPSDEAGAIDSDKAARIARLTFLLAWHVATDPEAPTWNEGALERVHEITGRLYSVEENLPEEMADEWNWKALVHWANSKQGGNYQEHQLKKMDRHEMIAVLLRRVLARASGRPRPRWPTG